MIVFEVLHAVTVWQLASGVMKPWTDPLKLNTPHGGSLFEHWLSLFAPTWMTSETESFWRWLHLMPKTHASRKQPANSAAADFQLSTNTHNDKKSALAHSQPGWRFGGQLEKLQYSYRVVFAAACWRRPHSLTHCTLLLLVKTACLELTAAADVSCCRCLCDSSPPPPHTCCRLHLGLVL